ncbi:DUF4870 domain-containing protein [Chloroflexota bacterium]
MEKTSIGLDENVAGLLCYVLGWISGIIFLLIEPKNNFVRFHAIQSIVVFATLNIAAFIVRVIPLLGAVLAWIIGVLGFILWIVLMIKAVQGAKYKLPWAGDFAEKRAG